MKQSEATKMRILDAAREVFADVGYERATIRTIAVRARIHPSMVIRYYESKEKLFTTASPTDLRLPDLSKIPRSQLGEYIVRTFLSRWETRNGAADMPAILRLSVTHPDGRERAIKIFTEQVRPMLDKVVGSKDSERISALIVTQIVGLAFLRYVMRLPAVVELSDDYLAERVGRTVQLYIDD